MPRSLRAIVHIGPMKVGTTAFASLLSHSEERGKLPPGWFYPSGEHWLGDDRGITKHHGLTKLAKVAKPPKPPRRRERWKIGGQRAVGPQAQPGELEQAIKDACWAARERAGDADGVIWFVCEGLSRQDGGSQFTELLRQYVDEIDYLLVARRQPFAVSSIVAHDIRDFARPERSEFASALYVGKQGFLRRFDYAAAIDSWKHDGARLHVVPYPEGPGASTVLLERMSARLALPLASLSTVKTEARRTHPTFSAEGLTELASIKLRYSNAGDDPKRKEAFEREFRAAWEKHHAAARDGLIEPWRLPGAEADLVRAAFNPSNVRFKQLLGTEADAPEWSEWFEDVGVNE